MKTEIICAAVAALATVLAVIIAQYKTKKLTYFQTYFDKKLSSYADFWAAIAFYEEAGTPQAKTKLLSSLHTVALFAPESIYLNALRASNKLQDRGLLDGESIEDLVSLMREDLDKCKKMKFD